MAEAIHSLADCANQGLLFLGMANARRPASREHPLGHGKALYFWSFVVALLLFSMGGLFSIYEGLHKIAAMRTLVGRSHGIENPGIAIAVLTLALAMEALSLTGALRESREARRGRSLWRWFRSSRQSELLVVVGEDVAALLGLSLALAAVVLSVVTGDVVYDGLGSVAIGALLVTVAVAVGVEIKSLLIGESAPPELEEEIRSRLGLDPAVLEVLHVITLQLGPDVMVAVKVRMNEMPSVARLAEEINRCERDLREAHPEIRWIFFEPDLVA